MHATLCLLLTVSLAAAAEEETGGSAGFRLATFSADVTPPLGHMLFTGRWKRAEGIDSPLEARGFVLLPPAGGGEKPVVCCLVDWAEIRNDAYDRWRDVLATAAGTTRERVLVAAIHQHDTPLADLEAQRILEAAGSPHQVIDLAFHEEVVNRVAAELQRGLGSAEPVTHIGSGRGCVEKIASNRRYLLPDGTVRYDRMSSGKNLAARRAPEGAIDPCVSALSFWHGDRALAVLSVYAVHPMSYYGTGRIGADFPGLARAARQAATPGVFQIYGSGCSGNVTAGKYNDGSPETRAVLAQRTGFFDLEVYALHLGPRLPRFWLWLLKEIVTSNIRVARIVLSREMPIEPTLVSIDASELSIVSQATLANAITLTPGTASVMLS